MEYLTAFLDYQSTWKSDDLVHYMQKHTELPFFAVGAYCWFIFSVPKYMENREPMKVRGLFAVWNLFLTVFSAVGLYYCAPLLLNVLANKPLTYSLCQNPSEDNYYHTGAPGLWSAFFMWSKFFELIDTVFLVIQKKPVIFLHWYHHITVLLYCWHCYVHKMSNGLWFSTMNYFVHSIMYFYYFAMAVNMKKLVRPIAPLITSIQIGQMVIGMLITIATWVVHEPESIAVCHADTSNIKMGLVMYGSYFYLFAKLFAKKYEKKPSKDAAAVSGTGKQSSVASKVTKTSMGKIH